MQGHYDHNGGTPDGNREISMLRGKMRRALPIPIGSGSCEHCDLKIWGLNAFKAVTIWNARRSILPIFWDGHLVKNILTLQNMEINYLYLYETPFSAHREYNMGLLCITLWRYLTRSIWREQLVWCFYSSFYWPRKAAEQIWFWRLSPRQTAIVPESTTKRP